MAQTPGPVVQGEDVSSASVTADGTMVSVPCRLRGVQARATGTNGSLVFKDGGSSGTTKLTVYLFASTAIYFEIPGGGIRFGTDVYLDLTNADGVTIFYA